jgi:putative oxidoreductase
MRYMVLAGRVLYAAIFINSGFFHFSSMAVEYARSQGVPISSILVPLSGVMAIAGGLSIAFGFKARAGAWILVAFLIPVTFFMHPFWNITDLMQQQVQMAMFMKNISMLGAALLVAWFGAGPVSFDAQRREH